MIPFLLVTGGENKNKEKHTALLAYGTIYDPNTIKKGSRLRRRIADLLWFSTVGGSAKPLGDLTHPAISGFYNAPYFKA
ncbi:MAG: hypothetical protein K2J77_09455, partial [Oscillospiraceae bacterium]|nr:hypothetical protein [Oscillospiraceae bacterium]